MVFLLGLWSASAAPAQDVSEPPPSSQPTMTARDLAKEVLNPFAESIKVPIESVTGFRVGPNRNTGESVNIEPVLPFAVTRAWNAIVQPLLSMTSLPSPDATTGFDDADVRVLNAHADW
jgi:hypothetical protein